jgi:succinyl-diaminopimelate desuccinylase
MATLTSFQKTFLKKLIAIPSIGGEAEEGAPYGKEPRKALDFFLKEAEKSGFKTGVTDDRAGWVEFGNGEKLIGILCHLDVVPAGEGWKSDPFTLTFTEEDDIGTVMAGRGIIDDKGPAAASFFAMKELMDEGKVPDNFRVRLILGTNEERDCSCVEFYAEHEEIPEFAITPDAEFPAIYCEKGILHVKVTGNAIEGFSADGGSAANMVPASAKCSVDIDEILVTGKPAHASRPEQGVNAISLLSDAIEGFGYDINDYPIMRFVKEFDGFEFTGCRITDESGELTSNIGLLKADEEGCSLIIDFRVPYSFSMNEAVENIKAKAHEYGLNAELDSAMESIFKDRHSPSILKLTDIWKKHMDKFTYFKDEYRDTYTEAIAIGGGTYARHIPNTIAFGPQAPWHEDKCHQAGESVALTDFMQWIEIIKEFIETYE